MHEQVVNRNNQGYGLPADIWSLGCTVLEMLTRQIPYSGLENVSVIFLIYCYDDADARFLVFVHVLFFISFGCF